MNEDQLNPDGTLQGAPSVPSDAEYRDAFAQLSANHQQRQQMAPPPPPPEDGLGKRVANFFGNLMPDRNTPAKYGKAIARGVVNAGRETADVLNSVAEATGNDFNASKEPGFVEHWYNKPLIDSTPMTDGEVEGMLGKREEGMAGFVESIAQFSTGMLAAGEVLKPLQLAKGAATLASGALADMTVFDPHQARLSNMVQDSPFANVVTGLLASDKNDSELTARLKAGAEGLITAYTMDKFIGGIKALRALKGAKTEAEKAAALDHLNVKHDPQVHGPVTVKQTEDGMYQLSAEESKATLASIGESGFAEKPVSSVELPKGQAGKVNTVQAVKHAKAAVGEAEFRRQAAEEIEKRGVKGNVDGEKAAIEEVARRIYHETDGPLVFEKAADAEAVAASANQAALNGAQPRGTLTDAQVKMITDRAGELSAESLPSWVHPDFNFNYMASPVEVKATIQAISEKMPLPKEVQTHAQTVALAEDMFDNMDGEQVVDALRKQNVAYKDMPQFITAARTYLESHAQKVASLSKAADAMPQNGIAFGELKKGMQHLYDIHESVAGLSKSIGRALDAHKIIVGESAADNADRAAMEALSAQAQKQALNDMDKGELLALARQIRMSEGNPKEILALLRGGTVLSRARKNLTLTQKLVEGVNSYRMEAMLSGPRTAFVNAVSNAMAAAQMPTEMWWGGVMTGNKAMRQQGADQLVGLFLEARDSFRAASKAWKSGQNYLDEAASFVNDGTAAQQSGFGAVIQKARVPSRVLQTTDEFFKTLNYRSSVRAQSLRLAREEGITDAKQLAERLADDMKAAFTTEVRDEAGNITRLSGAAINPKALQWARTATFQNPLEGGFGGGWQKLVQEIPELRLITPFVRTPVNLFRYAWQRTPVLGAFQKQMRADIAAGGELRAMAMAKQSMGAALFTGTAMLAHTKLITGGGPSDPQLKKQWLAAGNQPYSVKLPNGKWMSYQRGNPVFTAVGIVADLHQMSGELPEGVHVETAAAWAAAVAKNVTNQTFMQGVSDFIDAVSSGEEHKMMRMWSNLAGSYVPNVARQLDPNDTLREARGMLDQLKVRVPGFSDTLEPRRNIFGEPIMKAPGYLNQSLNPFTFMSDPGDHDVQQELLSLGKAMRMPSPQRGHVDLTDRTTYGDGPRKNQSPYDRWLELVSKSSARKEMTELVKSEKWRRHSDGTELFPGGRKFDDASQILSKHQERAWKRVLNEYPKLAQALKADVKAEAESMKSTDQPQFIEQ